MIFADVEADGLEPTKVHFLVAKTKDSEVEILEDVEATKAFARSTGSVRDAPIVGHNWIQYDMPTLKKLWGHQGNPKKVLDTKVISKLMNYSAYPKHSLDALSADGPFPKGEYKGDWQEVDQDMIDYAIRDVEALEWIFEQQRAFVFDPKNSAALRLEHDCQYDFTQMMGFGFDYSKAQALLENVQTELEAIDFSELDREELLFKDFKAFTAAGFRSMSLRKTVAQGYTVCSLPTGNFYINPETDKNLAFKLEKVKFNPGSHKQRIDILTEHGWKPKDKTLTHLKEERKGAVSAHTKKYGWKVNERNLETLPSSAPQSVKDLARWITLDSRRQSLEEYLGAVEFLHGTEEWVIKGKIETIGAWTHRCSHSGPNLANVVSNWREGKTPESPVEEVKARYDTEIRSLFTARKGYKLLGIDAKGIQLRILAHYMDDEEFTKELLEGDIHQKNMDILGPICKSRDVAKTFIYAWVLNAGVPKLAEILSCTVPKASEAKKNFETAWSKGLRKVNAFVDKATTHGGFEGLDGRWIKVPSRHKCLAGMLQSGEAIFMKRVLQELSPALKRNLAGFIHDEYQFNVCDNPDHEKTKDFWKAVVDPAFAKVTKDLKLTCPQEADYSPKKGLGDNWSETH